MTLPSFYTFYILNPPRREILRPRILPFRYPLLGRGELHGGGAGVMYDAQLVRFITGGCAVLCLR